MLTATRPMVAANRVRRGWRGPLTLVLVAGFVVVAILLVGSLTWPALFGTTEREQPNAVTLARLEELARFEAATGRFQTIVDRESDANLLPDWVKGERTVLVAEGDVAASVDFTGLGEDALEVSADGRAVTVHLPAPVLDEPELDRDGTRVIARDRGVLDRVDDALTSGDPSNHDELYARAEDKLAEAAAQSDLRAMAERNTTDLLTDLMRQAGFEQVTVVFDAAPPADPAAAA